MGTSPDHQPIQNRGAPTILTHRGKNLVARGQQCAGTFAPKIFASGPLVCAVPVEMKATFIFAMVGSLFSIARRPHPNFVFAKIRFSQYASGPNHRTPSDFKPWHDHTMSANPYVLCQNQRLGGVAFVANGNRAVVETMIIGQQVTIGANEAIIAHKHRSHHGQVGSLPRENTLSKRELWLILFFGVNPNETMPLNLRA